MSLTLVTAPTVEPIALNVAKEHLRVDNTNSDALITLLIKTARIWTENYLGRALEDQTWDLKLDGFPSRRNIDWPDQIDIPIPPLQSVTSINYVDTDGTTQTLATSTYQVDTSSEPARIVPSYGNYWPATRNQLNAVTVRFVAGHPRVGSPLETDVPAAIRHAMLLVIGELFERREEGIVAPIQRVPFSVQALLGPYRVIQFA